MKSIGFNPAMIRALVAGDKTETRRVVYPQPIDGQIVVESGIDGAVASDGGYLIDRASSSVKKQPVPLCEPDTVLWVRESWCLHYSLDNLSGLQVLDELNRSSIDLAGFPVFYNSTNHCVNWRGFIPGRQRLACFMPERFSRLRVRVPYLKYQRLQDISQLEAIGEGVIFQGFYLFDQCNDVRKLADVVADYRIDHFDTPKRAYENYWNYIHRLDPLKAWKMNPWVNVLGLELMNMKQARSGIVIKDDKSGGIT